ncbi:MAG: chemotaxis protein CheD [Spirochaetia bacterium]|nr:chemotaxis protein CheD [Spirochaetia bacterium]
MDQGTRVSVGEWKIGRNSDFLKTTLGSCAGIVLYSMKHKIGGIAHILLGEPPPGKIIHKGKYARTAIYSLVSELKSSGVPASDLKACLFGGATMFYSKNGNALQQIGNDNIRISKEVLKELDIPILLEDTGGKRGRSVILQIEDGKIRYSSADEEHAIYIS